METEEGRLLFRSGVWLLGELEFGQVREEKKNERLVRRGAPLLSLLRRAEKMSWFAGERRISLCFTGLRR